MLNIKNNTNGADGNIALEGRLDTTTAPELETALKAIFDSIDHLTLDFASLEYISSAGLRVLLSSQKTMQKKGGMVIKNVGADIQEIFNITGFADILTIQN